ncbi:MAG: AtpZ/AtpI family protein [Pseudomonadota bacterium]|nr:AtpZ/AtpI family protein [Pseudomonadota bacterium]
MSDNERHRGEDRLQEIDRRIERMRGEKGERQAPERHALPAGAGAILGRVATELVAGVIVGAFIGWALDRWLGTSPLFLVMLFFLGAAAGMLNVWRMVSGRGMATGYFDEHRQNAGRNIEQDDGQPSRKEDDR